MNLLSFLITTVIVMRPSDAFNLQSSFPKLVNNNRRNNFITTATTTTALRSQNEGDWSAIEVSRTYTSDEKTITTTHELKYKIDRKMRLSSQQAAPILVLHGGPGIPSDYLHPLTSHVPYRSIIYYDQLGCGRSPGPTNREAYSIDKSIDDLEILLKKIGVRKFHLYGQSFGGILAFEFLKRLAEKEDPSSDYECLSVCLSSTPCDVEKVENVANELIQKLLQEDSDESTIMERFRLSHQCRTDEKPKALEDAYAHAGAPGIWRGTQSIPKWKAKKSTLDKRRMPSAMIMRGEHDFVTEECISQWKDVFNHNFVRIKVLDKCSHHGLLENGAAYGEMIDSFFSEYD